MRRLSFPSLVIVSIGRLLGATAMMGLAACASALAQSPADETSNSAPNLQVSSTRAASIPLPSAAGLETFEGRLHAFLETRGYGEGHANWVHDRDVRNTGAFINGVNFGTHPSVRVYYSPEVWAWLKSGRKGKIPDGAMIIKEMYEPPAQARHPLRDWTVMVKDSKSSFDGWYWGYHSTRPDDYSQPQRNQRGAHHYPVAGFGLYCTNCHASAASEHTFITVRNVEGQAIRFDKAPEPNVTRSKQLDPHSTPKGQRTATLQQPLDHADPRCAALFAEIIDTSNSRVDSIPGETYDHVVSSGRGPEQFLTSDQCIGCHDATRSFPAITPNMIYDRSVDEAPVNLSAYGEWRASMMGLAGRDPIFFAQLESEKALHPTQARTIEHTCFRCHGVMGRRQLDLDSNGKETFSREYISAYATHDEPVAGKARYGALARDGVSCTVCHHIAPEGLGQPSTFSGNFHLGPPNEVYGPYEKAATLPMEHALGIKPRGDKAAEHIKSSSLCGSCHTIKLPVYDEKGNVLKEVYEQATYLEWLNSVYQNELKPLDQPSARSCQDCHMPKTYRGEALAFRIANIEDSTFPETDNRADDAALTLTEHKPYARHTLAGLNVFGLEMFQQFPYVLGVRTHDPMAPPGTEASLYVAERACLEMARNETATVSIEDLREHDGKLDAEIKVTNLAGHAFPSGVGFRRAFLEFQVQDAAGKVLWASGRTNALGVIVNGTTDQPLATEFFEPGAEGRPQFQPHHETITRGDQVQIYEAVSLDPAGHHTTSFLSLFEHIKDNRLQPRGWSATGPYAEHTRPHGDAAHDPHYQDGSGTDTIRYQVPLADLSGRPFKVVATLYYQSIPPSYLKQRFQTAHGPDTRRLHYFTTHLNLKGEPFENWKLPIQSAARDLTPASATRP